MTILAAVLFAAQAGCGFNITPETVSPLLQGPADTISRVQIVSQSNSPVMLVGADLSELSLTVDPPSFNNDFYLRGTIAVDVKNISDGPVSRITVRAKTAITSARERVRTLMPSIAPGQTVRTTIDIDAHGHVNADVLMSLFLDSVQTSDCVYHPSQAWPLTH